MSFSKNLLGSGGVLFISLLPLAVASDGGDPNASATARHTLQKILGQQPARPASDKITYYDGGKGSRALWNKAEYEHGIKDNCKNDEVQFLEIQDSLIYPWKSAWKTSDAQGFLKLLDGAAQIPDFANSEKTLSRHLGQITESNWPAVAKTVAGEGQKKSVEGYLSQFKKIDAIELATFQVKSDREDRAPDMSIRRARLTVRYDVRGFGKADERREDRGNLEVAVEKSSAGEWKITGIKAQGFQTLTSSKPSFVESTQVALNDQIPTYLRTEAIRRGGYALAFGDYDGDGKLDMYVGAKGKGTLLRGDGKGGFKVVADSGLGDDTLVKTAIFADFSNSGRQDLLLVRFTPEFQDGHRAKDNANNWEMRNDLVLYRNLGNGKFKRDNSIINDERTDYAMPAAVADFNKDGFLDFYVGFPGAKDFTTLINPAGSPADVQVQGLFLNQGGKGFKMTRQAAFAEDSFSKRSHTQKIFPHSAIAVDFNQDGNTDLIVVDDRGNLSPAYQNRGDGTFFQVAENIGVANDAFGMGVAATDFDNDGKLDLMMSNVNFLATRRLNSSCRANWGQPFAEKYEKSQDLRLFKGMGKGKFAEVTVPAGLDWAGEGLAGVEFIDYNNDGLMDIYVTNGLWSGTDERQDISSLFMRERENAITSRLLLNTPSNTVMDILRFFEGDVKTAAVGTARPEMAGHQRNRLFRNDGDGTFTEVGFLEGVDSEADGYMMAKADVNGDGVQDIILRNADPGSAQVNYPPVQIFLNQNPDHNKVLRLALEGTKSNRDGIGSEVTVRVGSQTQLQQVIANNGTVQSERTLSFGLGQADHADEVTIKWPSGTIQKLRDLPAGQNRIKESDSTVISSLQ